MITRENYEEFFLSYVDNELPAETRLAVERFVAAHPDLREELDTLLQCRLQPEYDPVFPDKNSLLQYEESFLLYIDGELDDAGRKAVEEQVHGQPHMAQELERLQLTVSRPDTAIVFPNKEILFSPAKRRRVVMMPWLQAGVAAAVVAAVVFLALPHGKKSDVLPGVAATAPGNAVKNRPSTVTPPATSPLYSVKKDEATRTEKDLATANAVKNGMTTKPALTKTPTLPAPAVAERAPLADTSSRSTALAVTRPTSTKTSTSPMTSANAMTSAHSTSLTDPTGPANAMTSSGQEKAAVPTTMVAAVYIPKEQSSFATQALLKEAQEQGKDDVVDNMPPPTGKTKLRGLFRKVTRALGKTADRDDDGQRQVSISVFQVALK